MSQDKKSTVLIFFINGIQSLLGWNAVLAALDFFANSFKDYNVYSFMPVPVFAGYLTVALGFHQTSNRFKYITHIMAGNIITMGALLMLLLVSLTMEQTLTGFALLLCISYVIGIGANLTQLTFFAMINYLSQDVVSKFTIGTAVSGLFIAITRAILTAIFGSDNPSSVATIIYFVIAIAFITFDLFLNVYFCNSSVYKQKIDYFLLHHDKEKQHHQRLGTIETPIEDRQFCINDAVRPDAYTQSESVTKDPPISDKQKVIQKKIQDQNYFMTLFQTGKAILPYPLVIMLNYIITFVLFPGPCFSKSVGNLDTTWCVIIYNLAYNSGDTLGKYVAGIEGFFNHKSLMYSFLLRLFFFLPITVMAVGADEGDALIDNYFFPFFNLFLFALTNGIVTNASFIMAFKVCPLAFKKYAGVLCGLLLQVGIMFGTIFEIPYAIILGIN